MRNENVEAVLRALVESALAGAHGNLAPSCESLAAVAFRVYSCVSNLEPYHHHESVYKIGMTACLFTVDRLRYNGMRLSFSVSFPKGSFMSSAFRNRFLAFVGAALACAPALAEPPATTAPPAPATVATDTTPASPATTKIRVALFADAGSMTGGDAVEKCLMKDAARYECFRVTAEDIRKGALDKADIVVLGGGSGSKEAATLKPEGCEKIKTFVRNGGGYIGICAGAYLASSYYPWSLHILNARTVDREHWARGGGDVQLRLTSGGKTTLAVVTDEVTCRYNQGPLLAPDTQADLPAYETLATFGTEIAKKGAPKGVMVGTTAVAYAPFGGGKVMCISPHPEATKGLDGIIRNAVDRVAPTKTAAPVVEPTK